jgi:hypothetical protein
MLACAFMVLDEQQDNVLMLARMKGRRLKGHSAHKN